MKQDILELTREELTEKFAELNMPAYRVDQVLDWVARKGCLDFEDMSNLSKSDRQLLSDQFRMGSLTLDQLEGDATDSAQKMVLRLASGSQIESVILRTKRYQSLCVSSQCGCPIDCKFCLTGISGFKSQLSTAEILSQLATAKALGNPISRVIFMGMGEPLINLDAVLPAIDRMIDPKWFGLSRRRITVSTSGILAGLNRLIDQKIYLNLAFSVGHPNPSKRKVLMPVEERNPIMEVVELLKTYLSMHNRKLTLEYTLLADQNDSDQAIRELINLAKYLHAKINLIDLNPHPKIPYQPVGTSRLKQISDLVKSANVPVTVRFRKGQAIFAACGQLGASSTIQT